MTDAFAERVLNHPLLAALQRLDEALRSVPEEIRSQADYWEPSGGLPRAQAVVETLGGLVHAADARLVSPEVLNAVNGQVEAALALANVLSGDQAFLTMSQHLDNALAASSGLMPALVLPREMARIGRTLGGALTTRASDLRERVQAIEGAVSEAQRQVAVLRAESDEALRGATHAVEARLAMLSAAVDEHRAHVESIGQTFEQQFSASQAAREAEFAANQTEVSATVTNTLAAVQASADDINKRISDAGATLLAEKGDELDAAVSDVEAKHRRVVDLYNAIVDGGTAGSFGKEASEQSDQANTWRRVAVTFATVAALVAITTVLVAARDDVSLKATISTVALSLALGGIAAYAANQSGRHRSREEDSKRMELELLAFGPFIREMGDDEQREARKEFLGRAFRGRPEPVSPSGENSEAITAATALLDAVARLRP